MNPIPDATKKSSSIFDVLPLKQREYIFAQSSLQKFKKNQTIFTLGEEGSWVLLIQEGVVEVSIVSVNGRKSTLDLMEANEILGEVSVLDGQPRSANAVAKTNVTGLVVHSKTMMSALKSNPDACIDIIKLLCSRVRNSSEMFEMQSLPNAEARLARCMLRLQKKWSKKQDDGSFTLTQNLTQVDLGDFSGLARENVNRHLKAWAREDIIVFDRGNITLLNLQKLNEIAEY